MSKVRFTYYPQYGYKCNQPGEMSGDYYPAADVERLVEVAREVELNWATIGWGYNPKLRDKLKAALEPFNGSTGPDS